MSNRKRNIKAVLLGLLVVSVIAFIWLNSFLDASASNKLSNIILRWLFPNGSGNNGGANSFLIRKAAHFIEYAVLGSTVAIVALFMRKNYGKVFVGLSLFGILMVAVIDEYIQSFSDRTSLVADILLDFSGAVVGLLLTVAVIWNLLLLVLKHFWAILP